MLNYIATPVQCASEAIVWGLSFCLLCKDRYCILKYYARHL